MDKLADLPINENCVFGLDVGIASCGWAVIDIQAKKILRMGAHCFEPSEDPKSKELKNQDRRQKRGQRRVIHRRAQRMKAVRRLLQKYKILADPSHESVQHLGKNAPDPWLSRVKGLTQKLAAEEAAAVLIHIAKHRGFQSNSKSDQGDQAPDDNKKILSAIKQSELKIDCYDGIFSRLVLEDPEYTGYRRNRGSNYNYTPKREWIRTEAEQIIRRQRSEGAVWASEKFERDYIGTAFFQRSLRSSESLVGDCPFENSEVGEAREKRTTKFAYSFERFRVLQKLTWIQVRTVGEPRRLTPDEITRVMEDFGKQKTMTYKALKKKIKLQKEDRFEQAPDDDKEKKDITGSNKGMCPGSYALRNVLGDSDWQIITQAPEKLDRIAEILTFNESIKDIRKKLEKEELYPAIFTAIMDAAEKGKFAAFKGAGHISALAARKLIPYLEKGMIYSEACSKAGYDHAAASQTTIDNIPNPVVQRSLRRARKQVEILIREYGKPGSIHVELLRDVGKSTKERQEIENGIKKRTTTKNKNREELAEYKKQDAYNIRSQELEMYELLKEQQCRCAYCDREIRPTELVGNYAQIDHIWPRSLFPDNSFVSKVLSCITCNQKKMQRTPWEWHEEGGFPDQWECFEARVRRFGCKSEKRRRLLSKNFRNRLNEDQQFANRHKVDSSYIARSLLTELSTFYPQDHEGRRIAAGSTRRLFSRPGQLTAMLRRSWLEEVYRKNRDDDRHHAVDALIVACCNEKTMQDLTRAFQSLEVTGKYKWTPQVTLPWESFKKDCLEAMEGWLVCRTENRRVRGPGHEETIRRVRQEGDRHIVYERKGKERIQEKDIPHIADANRNRNMIGHLAVWIAAGRPSESTDITADKIGKAQTELPEILSNVVNNLPKSINDDDAQSMSQLTEYLNDEETHEKLIELLVKWQNLEPSASLPHSPKGDAIRKIRICRGEATSGYLLERSGDGKDHVDNANMVRVDVYYVKEKRIDQEERKITPGYYLVPIYSWQIINKKLPTPKNAIVSNKSEHEWPEMNQRDFLFSIYKDSYIEIIKENDQETKESELKIGYYRTTDRRNGSITLSPHNNRRKMRRGIGVKKLVVLRKYTVDRFGVKHEVKKEKWPGAAST